MRRRAVRILNVPLGGTLPALAATAVFFSLGGLVGAVLAANVNGGGNGSLVSYIESYMAAAQLGTIRIPGLLPILWETLRWPLVTMLFGFTALGVIGIPILFALRGFFLSFAVASFVRMFGGAGGMLAFAAFGLTGLIAVPVLFVLGVQGLMSAKGLAGQYGADGRHIRPFSQTYFVRCGLCAAALSVCVLLEYFAVPVLLRAVASFF